MASCTISCASSALPVASRAITNARRSTPARKRSRACVGSSGDSSIYVYRRPRYSRHHPSLTTGRSGVGTVSSAMTHRPASVKTTPPFNPYNNAWYLLRLTGETARLWAVVANAISEPGGLFPPPPSLSPPGGGGGGGGGPRPPAAWEGA